MPTEQGFLPSILDRLIDPDSSGTAWRQGYGMEQMLEAVRRDLEELLNTRQTSGDLPRGLQQTRKSIHAFGLPDLTSFHALTSDQREKLARTLEETVAAFEPRLRDIRATLHFTDDDLKKRTVRIRIEARVAVDPAPEVAFDTVLELMTGQHSVQKS
ncbi:MAG: type VI secretion system baseplate subunit TssE [Gemmataceae bacterium]|nr:type VI secretion system baseplate subunit TssE [Gemmataceae bacterium]